MSVATATRASKPPLNQVLRGDNLPLLKTLPDESAQFIYIDPPFNTGVKQTRKRIKTTASENGARVGYAGKRYTDELISEIGYDDSFSDYLGFLEPRLREAHRILTPTGSLFFHIDWREAANCRLLLQRIFGGARHCINEIIWAYDYGARSKKRWSTKHDNIYWFAKDADNYIFNYDALERIPYMAPGLVGEEKAARGKTPTDVWWHTIVAPSSKENTGYPTQKPVDILRWLIAAHTNPGDTVLDFFAGAGTCGVAAKQLMRNYILIDGKQESVDIAGARLAEETPATQLEQAAHSEVLALGRTMRPDRANWLYADAQWLLCAPPAVKQKAGREIARKIAAFICGGNNVAAHNGGGNEPALKIHGKKVAVNFSMLLDGGEGGEFHFEQIKQGKECFSAYCFLGIAPTGYYLWLAPASECDNFDEQHNANSRWVTVNITDANAPATAIAWHKYGGHLSSVSRRHFNFLKTQ